jgi:Leucine-rich repeat (LRR) protein
VTEKELLDVEIYNAKVQYSKLNGDFLVQINEISSLTTRAAGLETDLMTCSDERTELTGKVTCLTEQVTILERFEAENQNLTENLKVCDEKVLKVEEEVRNLQDMMEELEASAEKCLDVNGTCRFVQDKTYGYTCIAHGIEMKSEEEEAAVEWTGSHSSVGLNNTEVVGLVMKGLNVAFIPKGVADAFTQLRSLVINNCGLKTIKKENFEGLEKLERLEVTDNEGLSLSAGVFDSLSDLIHLDLSDNSITSLPSKIFSKLSNLEVLLLNENQLSSVKYDLVPSANKIVRLEAVDNRLAKLDVTFVWRLNKAEVIDFSGNGCGYSYNLESDSFLEFYAKILSNC